MLKKTISFVLALAMLAACIMTLPVAAEPEALTDIQSGGTWGTKEVVTADEFLSNLISVNQVCAYDEDTQTITQSGYSTFQMTNFQRLLLLNREEDGKMEISMTVVPSGTLETMFPDNLELTEEPGEASKSYSRNARAWTMRFFPYIDGKTKNTSSTSYGLNVRYDRTNQKATYSFPWNGTPTLDFVSGTEIPLKYVVEKKDGVLTAVNWAQIAGEWIEGDDVCALETPADGETGILTSVGFMFGVNSDRNDLADIKWKFQDVSVTEMAPETARLSDLSEEFYAQNDVVDLDFVLPEGYDTATLTVDGEAIAIFDPASFPADGYTSKLNLGAIGKVAEMDVVLSGTGINGSFTLATTVKSGIDPNYVPPMSVPAKVSFQNLDGTRLTAIAANAKVKAVANEDLKEKLVILGLYQDNVLKAIKSGTGEAVLDVPADVTPAKVTLRAFIVDNLDNANPLVRAGQWNSSDLSLADLLINGKPLEGYSDDKTSYDVNLPASFVTWPVLDPVANNSATSAVVTYSGAFPGTNTVTLTAEDGTTKNITLNYTQDEPKILNPRTAADGYSLITKVLEKPEFKVQPTEPVFSGTNELKNQNQQYKPDNIKNLISLFNDRTSPTSSGYFYLVDLPDELVGATLVSPPYNSSFWSNSANHEKQTALMSFELDRSATVYLYIGGGFKKSDWKAEATWISDEGWKQNIPFEQPIYLQYSSTSGYYSSHVKNWPGYQKHFEVDPWGEPVTVNIGAMGWGTNIIIVKYD